MNKDGKKTGGRKAGTPNKKTVALAERLRDLGVDTLAIMAEFAFHKDDGLRFAAIKELMQYEFPKRKAIEHSGELKKHKVLEIRKPDGSGIRIVRDDENDD